jgi:hypothetical protein
MIENLDEVRVFNRWIPLLSEFGCGENRLPRLQGHRLVSSRNVENESIYVASRSFAGFAVNDHVS